MFSSSRMESCFQSFLIYVSSSTQLLVNLINQKKISSHLLIESHKRHKRSICNVNKVYIVIYLLLSVISISNCAAHLETTTDVLNLEEIGAIFHKVAYPTSTTTTKRSITDNVYVPSITTVPTPSLTTFRYVSNLLYSTVFYINFLCVLLIPLSIQFKLILFLLSSSTFIRDGLSVVLFLILILSFCAVLPSSKQQKI